MNTQKIYENSISLNIALKVYANTHTRVKRKAQIIRLKQIALQGLTDANQHNPFWSQSEAMTSLNMTRRLL